MSVLSGLIKTRTAKQDPAKELTEEGLKIIEEMRKVGERDPLQANHYATLATALFTAATAVIALDARNDVARR
ncbi:hypothetical protein [Kitasatospora sp. NPDC002965]|uniref:hypothetical protein n=1 Tax=Kitasatospora sp. NPDC002965 TaxID=3154775 RepID=UPI0033BDBCC7